MVKEAESKGKEKLIEREINRQTNETKHKLEKALYTEDDSDLEQKELDFLVLLSDLKRQNSKLDQMGIKVEAQEDKKTAEKLKYYQQKDGSKRFDESKDGSLRMQREIRELDAKIHGPAVDIIDLINNIGKK